MTSTDWNSLCFPSTFRACQRIRYAPSTNNSLGTSQSESHDLDKGCECYSRLAGKHTSPEEAPVLHGPDILPADRTRCDPTMEAIPAQTLQATHELGKHLLTICGAEAKKCGARRKLGKTRHTCWLVAIEGRAYHEIRCFTARNKLPCAAVQQLPGGRSALLARSLLEARWVALDSRTFGDLESASTVTATLAIKGRHSQSYATYEI
ncbi:hypothetical protein MRX96_043144 [Rhipicephalus microplus]